MRLGERRRPLPRERLRRRDVQVDAAGLEEGDGAGVAGEVAGGDVEQRAEQERPHRRLLLGERVGEQDGVGARVVRGDPQPPGLARVGEAPADDLVEAEAAQGVLGPPAQPLLAAEAADPLPRRGQRRRQVLVESVDPADLLDQVDLAGDVVVAVGRDLHLEVLAVDLDAEAEPLQVGGLVGLRDRHPQQALDPGRPQADPRRRRDLGGDVDRPRHQLRPAELDQQPRGEPLRPHAEVRVQLLLEARGGLGAQPQQARGAEDVGAVPVGDLEQDAGRLLGDLGDLAAHDPGDPGGPVAGRRPARSRRRARARPRRGSSSSRRPPRCARSARRREPGRGRRRAAAARSAASRSW